MKKTFILALCLILGMYSCSKDFQNTSDQKNDGITVIDGVLCFSAPEDFFNYVEEVTKPDVDITLFEKKYGYLSLASFMNDLEETFDEIEDIEELKRTVECYENWFSIDETGAVFRNYKSYGHLCIANTEGCYFVAGKKYQLTADAIFVYPDADTRSGEAVSVPYWFATEEESTRAERDDQIVSRYYKHGDDRWVFNWASTIAYYTQNSNGTYSVKYSFQIHSKSTKAKILGNSAYKTIHMIDNLVFNISVPNQTGNYSNPIAFLKSTYTERGDDASYQSGETKNYYLTFNGSGTYTLNYPYQPELISLRYRNRTRGTANCGVAVNLNVPSKYSILPQCIK